MDNQVHQKTYYPQLDAIRGIGVLVVFLYHSYKPVFGTTLLMQFLSFCYNQLYLSMDIFLALSAFFITHISLNEYKQTNTFSFRFFMVRRILRIWPLYFLILFFSFVILKIYTVHYSIPITMPPAKWYIFFISNFYTEPHVFYLRQLWTISVEEQFYVVWGLVLYFFIERLKWFIGLFLCISIVFCYYSELNHNSVFFHSLIYLYDMMIGSLMAYLIYKKSKIVEKIKFFSTQQNAIFYLFIPCFFILYFFLNKNIKGFGNDILVVTMKLIFILHHGFLFINQMLNKNRIFNLSNQKFLTYTGKISYSLYCIHAIVLTFGLIMLKKINIILTKELYAIIMFGISYLLAMISYHYYEIRFLRLKQRFNKA